MTPEYCDRCPSRAAYAVELSDAMGGGVLTFCGHHMSANREVLEGVGASITSLTPEPATVGA